MRRFRVRRDAGQAIAIMVLSMGVVVMAAGIAVDGGYALVQRRTAQNAADFSALAAARIVAVWIADNTNDGTDANVKSAINAALASNGGATVTYGATGSPVYVSEDGTVLGYVGTGTIPSFSVGIRVTVTKSWAPYFLKIIGVSGWSASATATARGGYYAQRIPGAVFPAGIAEAFFNHRQPCSAGAINTTDSNDACYPKKLTPGTLNVPGGFGWLKFGCDGYGLGQAPPANTDGCATNLGFLQQQIGPPANSYGCCDTVGQPGSPDRIGSLPGNKTPADCSYWIATGKTLPVPVWDYAGGTGSNAWYHIVGYTGFQITDCDGGKSLSGVWRQPFFLGPTTTAPGFAGAPLAVQLIK